VASCILLRLLPLNWGAYISEFDPYFQYDSTRYIVTQGYSSWFSWNQTKAWYPNGRDIARSSFPGVPFSGALFYFILHALGISVNLIDACIFFPIVMAALTCIIVYMFGRDIAGEKVGIFCSLFVAFNPSYILRTSLGFYDDETIGLFGFLLASIFYLRSLDSKHSTTVNLIYSVAAGLSLGYLAASWGASSYVFSLFALFSFILLLMGYNPHHLFRSDMFLTITSLFIACHVPKLGFSYLNQFEITVTLGVLLLLFINAVSQRFRTRFFRQSFIIGSLIAISLSVLLLWNYGLIHLPAERFLSVLNPFIRSENPIVQSVQEHQPSTWATFFYDFGLLVFFAPIGFVFVFRKLNYYNTFLIVYFITSLYFAASMVRLIIILAPAFCLLSSIALVNILQIFIGATSQKEIVRRKMRFIPNIRRGTGIASAIVLFLLLFPTLYVSINGAYAPTTIASSTIPVKTSYSDWSESLTWMYYNIPNDAVVASWWDYGYWIYIIANKTSLADNGTLDTEQIAKIGRMFLSNETQALHILNDFNASYVVVFTTISQGIAYGDEVKWNWMALIGGLNVSSLVDDYLYQTTQFQFPRRDLVLTKLIFYGTGYYSAYEVEAPEHFKLVFSSSNRMVFVYKVEK
jgi:dolichyl-diphosphooligosaccharide--protein glycosyltransferase